MNEPLTHSLTHSLTQSVPVMVRYISILKVILFAVFCDWHWNFRNFKQVAEDDVYLSGAAVPHVNVTALKSCLTQEDNGWPFYVVNLIKVTIPCWI
jgi:hypothetical protein